MSESPVRMPVDVRRFPWIRKLASEGVQLGWETRLVPSASGVILRHAGKDLRLAVPVPGAVTEVNEAVVKNPALLTSDPYGAGWLVKVRPTNLDAERSHLLTGAAAVEAYQKKIVELGVKCYRCVDDTAT